MGLGNFIKNEWNGLTAAPGTFVGGGILLAGMTATLTFMLTGWSYDREISTLNSIIRQKDSEIVELNAIHRRMDDFERRLSEQQKETLTKELSGKEGRVTLNNFDPRNPLANELRNIFENSGWTVDLVYGVGQEVDVIGDDASSYVVLNRALSDIGFSDLVNADSTPRHSPNPSSESNQAPSLEPGNQGGRGSSLRQLPNRSLEGAPALKPPHADTEPTHRH